MEFFVKEAFEQTPFTNFMVGFSSNLDYLTDLHAQNMARKADCRLLSERQETVGSLYEKVVMFLRNEGQTKVSSNVARQTYGAHMLAATLANMPRDMPVEVFNIACSGYAACFYRTQQRSPLGALLVKISY